jgi:mycofactocin system creatininase family protein
LILGSATWTELAGPAAGSTLVVPLGSTEQHGPHLPLSTDTDIAVAVAEGAAELRPHVVVAPALPYGSSGEHAGFPGTLSIGQAALEHVVVELVRSADAFGAVVLASGHGGNLEALRRAVATLTGEGRRVALWTPSGAVDAHAGRTETSISLALDPARVRLDRAEPGDLRPIGELLPSLRAGGIRSVAPNGVLGDPSGASAEEGLQLLAVLVADLVATVDELAVRG